MKVQRSYWLINFSPQAVCSSAHLMLEIRLLVVVARLTKVVSWFHSSKTAGLTSKPLIPTKEKPFCIRDPTCKQTNALQVSQVKLE